MWVTIMMPLRVAIPNKVMNPMIEAIEMTPPERNTPTTPPMSASGRLSITSAASRAEDRATYSSKKMPRTTSPPSQSNVCVASAAASNCPPYST